MSLIAYYPLQKTLDNYGAHPEIELYSHGNFKYSSNYNTESAGKTDFYCANLVDTTAYCQIYLEDLGLETSDTLSYAAWYKIPEITDYRHLFEFWTSGTDRFLVETLGVSSTVGELRVWSTSGDPALTFNTRITAKKWFHFAMSIKNGIPTFYINGIKQNNDDAARYTIYTNCLYIGTGGSGTDTYNLTGYVCDIRIYDHAITTNEVQELANSLCWNSKFNFEDLYLPVEYIQSTGTQWIDTEVNLYGKQIIWEMDGQFLKIPNNILGVMGAYDGSKRFHIGLYPSNAGYHPGVGSEYGFLGPSGTGTAPTDYLRHNFYLDSAGVFKMDSIDKWTLGQGSLPNLNLWLFGGNWSGALPADAGAGGYVPIFRLYSCKIYENGNLSRNFIPVIRKTDLKPGLFDLINYKFYENQNTNGEDFEIPSNTYFQVDYIQSTGTQYIETGIGYKNNCTFKQELDMAINLPSGSDATWVEGRTGHHHDWITARRVSSTPEASIYWNDNYLGSSYRNRFIYTSEWAAGIANGDQGAAISHHMQARYSDSGNVAYDNTVEAKPWDNKQYLLFACTNNDPKFSDGLLPLMKDIDSNIYAQTYPQMTLYGAKYYINGTLVGNFIPYINVNFNEPCLYDTVTGKYFYNSGTGRFKAYKNGNEIKTTDKKYHPVAFIKTNCKAYIDTEIKATNNTSIEVVAQEVSNSLLINSIFGGDTGYFNYTTSDTYPAGYLYYAGNYQAAVGTSTSYLSDRTTIKVDAINHKLIRKSNNIFNDEYSLSTTTFTDTKSLLLFARNMATSPDPGYVKVYSCKIWEGSNLIRDYLPCIDQETGEVGLYELVNKTFIPTTNGKLYSSSKIIRGYYLGECTKAQGYGIICDTDIGNIEKITTRDKTSDSWTKSGFFTKNTITGDCYVEATVEQTNGGLMIGLTGITSGRTDSYSQLHAIYATSWGTVEIYDFSRGRTAEAWTSYAVGDRLGVKRIMDNGTAVYTFYKNGEVYTGWTGRFTDEDSTRPAKGAAMFYSTNNPAITNFRFIPINDRTNTENNSEYLLQNYFAKDIVTTADTVVGNLALVFNGTSSYISYKTRPTYILEDFTLNIWAYSENWNSGRDESLITCANETGGISRGGWDIMLKDTRLYFGATADGQNWTSADYARINIAPGWHMITGVRGNSKLSLYLDGILLNSVSFGSAKIIYANSGCPLVFGAEPSNYGYGGTITYSNHFNGKIAEIKMYTAALNANTVKDLYITKGTIDKNNIVSYKDYQTNSTNLLPIYPEINIHANALLEKMAPNYYHFMKNLVSGSTAYQGLRINESYFIKDHYYKISFDVKSNEPVDINYIRGHANGFTTLGMFIDGQKITSSSNWHDLPRSGMTAEEIELEKIYPRWKHYDIYVKFNQNSGDSNNNFYIQPNRGTTGDSFCNSDFANISVVDFGLKMNTVDLVDLCGDVIIANKQGTTISTDIIESQVLNNIEGVPNKNCTYLSKNNILVAKEIKEN